MRTSLSFMAGEDADGPKLNAQRQRQKHSIMSITKRQQELISTIVALVRKKSLKESFSASDANRGGVIVFNSLSSPVAHFPDATTQSFQALANEGLLIMTVVEARFGLLDCSLTGKAYEAVDSNFNAPDTSFLKQLTPLADVTNFDSALKQRCLPMLGAGAADPMLWDSAVRTAGVILEDRVRDVGKITDRNLIGRDLVNKVFGQSGSLAHKFTVPGERDGYRDLFAGVVGVIRNPSAHLLIDPTPEEGGATLVFVNLLLKKLELLR
jgi:hypothetical protein